MITKTYKAKTLPEAIEIIKHEMGQRASIVATKKIKTKKGLFRLPEDFIEVTAKVDEKYLNQEQLEILEKEQGKDSKKGVMEKLQGIKVSLSQQAREKIRQQEIEAHQLKGEEFNRQIDSLNHTDPPSIAAHDESPLPHDKLALIDEVLKTQGVHQELIQVWHTHYDTLPQNLTPDELWDECISFFLDQFIPFHSKLPRIVGFVGPAGSGKTAMVLKLAHLLKNKKKKIAIFTLDGNMGVTEQMKLATSEMEVPFCVIYQMRTFQNAIKEFQDYDHILIDTYPVAAGERQRIASLQKKLMQMQAPCLAILSARDADSDVTIQMLQGFNIIALGFSRIDELYSAGLVFNLIHKTRLPVAYFGIGRKIDEDIEEATAERLVSILFRVDEPQDANLTPPEPLVSDNRLS